MIRLNFAPKWWNWRLNWKILGLYSSWLPQLFSIVKEAGASLTEISSWEKLDWATQLWNGLRGSKYSLNHSGLSGLLILLSYLIPTVPAFQQYWLSSPCLGKDDLDTLGGIYLHVTVIYLPLRYLEFYTINFPKTQVVECPILVYSS